MSFFSALRQFYFSGRYHILYEVSDTTDWEQTIAGFQKIVAYNQQQDPEMLVTILPQVITITQEKPSSLRYPNETLFTFAEIKKTDTGITLYIELSISGHFDYFMPVFKGFIFLVSLALATLSTAFIVAGKIQKETFLLLIPILIFNGAIGIMQLLFNAEAQSVFQKIMRIIKDSGNTNN